MAGDGVFRAVSVGDPFMSGMTLYMRTFDIEGLCEVVSEDRVCYNCVNLSNGRPGCFHDSDEVMFADVKVVVE